MTTVSIRHNDIFGIQAQSANLDLQVLRADRDIILWPDRSAMGVLMRVTMKRVFAPNRIIIGVIGI